MPSLTHDSEHVTRGVARLIDRYRHERTSALLASWLGEVQAVEDALWQLLVERSVDSAVGAQLDVLGAIVGQPREGRDDETYRLWISARNMVSRSSGTTTQVLAIARQIVPAGVDATLEEHYPAAFVVRLHGPIDERTGYHVAHMLHLAKAAGVLFQMTWAVDPDADIFTMATLPDTSDLDSALGFDRGAFELVADGSFIPPEPAPLPAGALVLDGVPLAIGGVPIVITPTR